MIMQMIMKFDKDLKHSVHSRSDNLSQVMAHLMGPDLINLGTALLWHYIWLDQFKAAAVFAIKFSFAFKLSIAMSTAQLAQSSTCSLLLIVGTNLICSTSQLAQRCQEHDLHKALPAAFHSTVGTNLFFYCPLILWLSKIMQIGL